MAAGMTADLRAGGRQLSYFGRRIGRQRLTDLYILRKRLATQPVVGRNEIRERNVVPSQQRYGEAQVVGIAVVERDAYRRNTIASGCDSRLGLGQALQIESP